MHFIPDADIDLGLTQATQRLLARCIAAKQWQAVAQIEGKTMEYVREKYKQGFPAMVIRKKPTAVIAKKPKQPPKGGGRGKVGTTPDPAWCKSVNERCKALGWTRRDPSMWVRGYKYKTVVKALCPSGKVNSLIAEAIEAALASGESAVSAQQVAA